MADYLDIARRVIADLKAQAPATAPDPEKSLALVRKGRAVLLASDLLGEHIWIVADKEDAAQLRAEEPNATTYDLTEVEILVAIEDPAIVREIHQFKRTFQKGRVSRGGHR